MKVLLLTPSVRLLGARQSLFALAQHLPRGAEPLVVCPSEGGLTAALRDAGVPVEVVPHGAWRKLAGRLRAETRQIPALRRVVERFRPDAIHCNEYHMAPQGVRARGAARVTAHIRLGIPRAHVAKYLLGECDRIAAVSNACGSLLDGTGLEDRVEVVYNGVDVASLAAASRDRSLRAECGWSGDDLVLGLLGLIAPRKNQLVAAEAVALAAKRGVPARLLVAGDAFKDSVDYGKRLRERIAAADLRDRVRWLPFQADVARVYAACDVNLLISGEEGFGRTIIEAGALGVPSIGSRVGGIPELIVEGETGFLVGEGSVEELAACIERIWRSREQLAALGEAASRRVRAHFTIEAHAAAMVRFWEKAIESGSRE